MTRNKNFRRKNARRSNRRPYRSSMNALQRASVIPSLVETIGCHHKFRFKSSGAPVDEDITPRLLCGLYCVAVSTSSLSAVFDHVILRRIEMWAPTAADNLPVTCRIEWAGNVDTGDSRIHEATTATSSVPAHLVVRPPASLLRFPCVYTDTTSLYKITCPANTIIDVTVDYIGGDSGVNSVLYGVTGVTAGAMYYGRLDGYAGGIPAYGVPAAAVGP
jgi:hypothetical protein